MSGRARVWNVADKHHQAKEMPDFHVEKFKGQTLSIPKGGFIEMEYFDAIEFKSQGYPMAVVNGVHRPVKKDKWGNVVPGCGFKMIKVEKIPDSEEVEPEVYLSHLTGEKFHSKDAFIKHLAENKDKVDDGKPDHRKKAII